MGCDIHLYAEFRTGAGEPWQMVGKSVEAGEGEDAYTDFPRFYEGRNYGLFGILSGVRWRCPHGVIARDRGVPADASQEMKRALRSYGEDGHSHSYCTLAEILAYDFTRTIDDSHLVHAHEFDRWMRWSKRKLEAPESAYMARRPEIEGKLTEAETISQQEMEARYERFQAACRAKYDARERFDHDTLRREIMGNVMAEITFPVPLYDVAGEFAKRTIWKLAALGAPENVRICFFYDN